MLLSGLMLGLLAACGGNNPSANDPSAQLQAVQQRGYLLAGVKFDSKPFGYLDTDGSLKGFDVDLIRELARRLLGSEDRVKFQQVLSSTRIIALNSGTVDLVAATMTITPERAKVVRFSQPYYVAGQAVLVPKASAVQSVQDLAGKTVLFALGATSEENLRAAVPTVALKGFKSSTEAFSALKAKRGDAMTSDDTILSGFLASDCSFRLLPERLTEEPYGIAFRQDESTVSLAEAVDAQLQLMKQDGTLKKLQAKWMPSSQTACSLSRS